MSTPTQPNQAQYQMGALNLFPTYPDRATYQKETGQQAPVFDPTRAIQQFFDPAAVGATGTFTYTVFDPNSPPNSNIPGSQGGYGQTKTISLTAAQAGTVNLPGPYVYPAYTVAPTDAVEVGPYGPIGQVNANTVCLQADAQNVANAIASLYPGQTPQVVLPNTGVFYNQYGVDPRRAYVFAIGTQNFNAQLLIGQMNSHGVGAPGSWTLSAQNQPLWVPATPVTTAPANAIILPAPIRPLEPNEQLVHIPGNPFNALGTWVVERTDINQAPVLSNDQQFAQLEEALTTLTQNLVALTAEVAVIKTKVGA